MTTTNIDITKHVNYYLRNESNQPITSVTVIRNTSGKIARGVAICNSRDHFSKSEGRTLSRLRSIKALKKENNFGKIKRDNILIDDLFNFKCEFMPELTEYESKLLLDPIKK